MRTRSQIDFDRPSFDTEDGDVLEISVVESAAKRPPSQTQEEAEAKINRGISQMLLGEPMAVDGYDYGVDPNLSPEDRPAMEAAVIDDEPKEGRSRDMISLDDEPHSSPSITASVKAKYRGNPTPLISLTNRRKTNRQNGQHLPKPSAHQRTRDHYL